MKNKTILEVENFKKDIEFRILNILPRKELIRQLNFYLRTDNNYFTNIKKLELVRLNYFTKKLVDGEK